MILIEKVGVDEAVADPVADTVTDVFAEDTGSVLDTLSCGPANMFPYCITCHKCQI